MEWTRRGTAVGCGLLAGLGVVLLAGRSWGAERAAALPSGYTEDAQCASCHPEIAASYAEVGMSQSFFEPSTEKVIEDFSQDYYHPASDRFYEMREEHGSYVFRRYQLDSAGERMLEVEQPIDWILGSGHTSRTYLYRVPSGELYQLPLAWYTQEQGWAMAPGFDGSDHPAMYRRVRRECMFCHNAYPAYAEASDRYGERPVFPEVLPQGTGCQRCHGPGAEHVETVMMGGNLASARSSIVNPGRLAIERQRDVCYSCHMQPSVALFGVRRFGRADYSFRPGEALASYAVQVDLDEVGRERSDRFEINHHPYRLEQSTCFQQSETMTCLTCHDPHRKVPKADRAAHYRAACQSCHEADVCERPGHVAGQADTSDCVSCHMQRRRTQDVVHVTMTDHFIRPAPSAEDLLAPLEEGVPVLEGVELHDPEAADGLLEELYLTAAITRVVGSISTSAVDRLEALLLQAPQPEPEPYLYLAQGLVERQEFERALEALTELEKRAPGHPKLRSWRALAKSRTGDGPGAIEDLRSLLAEDPLDGGASFNLALTYLLEGRVQEAGEELQRTARLQPNHAKTWYYVGRVALAQSRDEAAREAFERALSLDPKHTRAYVDLVKLLLASGEKAEAARYLAHGERNARAPKELPRLEGSP